MTAAKQRQPDPVTPTTVRRRKASIGKTARINGIRCSHCDVPVSERLGRRTGIRVRNRLLVIDDSTGHVSMKCTACGEHTPLPLQYTERNAALIDTRGNTSVA